MRAATLLAMTALLTAATGCDRLPGRGGEDQPCFGNAECGAGLECNADNRCVRTDCTPDCDDKCGGAPDGCGGSCQGACDSGFWCDGQSCAACGADDAHCGAGCIDCSANDNNRACVPDDSGGHRCGCDSDADCDGESCIDRACGGCTPACDGRCNQVADGCGGFCPLDCPAGQWCDADNGDICQPCQEAAHCGADCDNCSDNEQNKACIDDGGDFRCGCTTGEDCDGLVCDMYHYCSDCEPDCSDKCEGELDGCDGFCPDPCQQQGEYCEGGHCYRCAEDEHCGPNCVDCTQNPGSYCIEDGQGGRICGCRDSLDCDNAELCNQGVCEVGGTLLSDYGDNANGQEITALALQTRPFDDPPTRRLALSWHEGDTHTYVAIVAIDEAQRNLVEQAYIDMGAASAKVLDFAWVPTEAALFYSTSSDALGLLGYDGSDWGDQSQQIGQDPSAGQIAANPAASRLVVGHSNWTQVFPVNLPALGAPVAGYEGIANACSGQELAEAAYTADGRMLVVACALEADHGSSGLYATVASPGDSEGATQQFLSDWKIEALALPANSAAGLADNTVAVLRNYLKEADTRVLTAMVELDDAGTVDWEIDLTVEEIGPLVYAYDDQVLLVGCTDGNLTGVDLAAGPAGTVRLANTYSAFGECETPMLLAVHQDLLFAACGGIVKMFDLAAVLRLMGFAAGRGR